MGFFGSPFNLNLKLFARLSFYLCLLAIAELYLHRFLASKKIKSGHEYLRLKLFFDNLQIWQKYENYVCVPTEVE